VLGVYFNSGGWVSPPRLQLAPVGGEFPPHHCELASWWDAKVGWGGGSGLCCILAVWLGGWLGGPCRH